MVHIDLGIRLIPTNFANYGLLGFLGFKAWSFAGLENTYKYGYTWV